MKSQSAGILLFRRKNEQFELLLIHPGGPFWASKDAGGWSIPKGLFDDAEAPLAAARREFAEEVGYSPDGEFLELGAFRQPSGKTIYAWALEGDFDQADLSSNTFSMEWPPRSGQMKEFPEADRAAWFGPAVALEKITKGQMPIIHALLQRMGIAP